MDRDVYKAMAAEEDTHWWFVGRRAVLRALIARRAAPPNGSRVLDMGCGSGGNLAMLSEFGTVEGIEYDADARALAAARGVGPVKAGALPGDLDVPDGAFRLIGLFDVLEHIEQDGAALQTLGRKLAPGGRLVISVPALPWLWSQHDVAHHHFRRYTRAGLASTIRTSGLTLEICGHFNTLLFPIALAQRGVQKLTGLGTAAAAQPARPVNAGLAAIFAAERHLIGRVPLPIGLSLFAVAARP